MLSFIVMWTENGKRKLIIIQILATTFFGFTCSSFYVQSNEYPEKKGLKEAVLFARMWEPLSLQALVWFKL